MKTNATKIQYDISVEMVTDICCVCGIAFAMPKRFAKERRENHEDFYCPSGHCLVYKGKTKEEKLQEELEQLQRTSEWYRRKAEQNARRVAAYKGTITKIKKRLHNGVCPHCNRHFENLQRHMETKHADEKKETQTTN